MSLCTQHPEAPAVYQCDGCQKFLCGECVEESHVLLLCAHCGERALPLEAGQAADVRELRKQEVVDQPYNLTDALLYPFRGSGPFLFAGTALGFLICWLASFACVGFLAYGFLGLMIIGLQFKIVRSTSDGKNELPDWPDFTDIGGLVADFFTWLVINFLQILPIIFYAYSTLAMAFGQKPNPVTWIGVAAVAWVGMAVALMGWGAAGSYRRIKVLSFPQHVIAYLGALPDSIQITNVTFGLLIATTAIQEVLEGSLPLLGSALSSLVGIYWIFMVPHLGGLIFRRHNDLMDKVYWPDKDDP